MKGLQVGLWSVWLYGLLLIGLSLFATHKLPAFNIPIFNQNDLSYFDDPKITIFSAPVPFIGSAAKSQSLAIRSWLALSPHISIVLFSQHPSAASFASAFTSQVLVDSTIDFTFLGTPFFHSMIERSKLFASDISVFINAETIVLPDLISTLNIAYKLDFDWFLVASPRNVSHFPFKLDDDDGKHWITKDGNLMGVQEAVLGWHWQWNHCEDGMILAWNNVNVPLHNGVLPPFLYGKGIHNHWLVNEAVLSEFRFVFDASWAVSSFSLACSDCLSNPFVGDSSVLHIENRSWEYVGNSHLGAQYGSLFFRETNYSSLVKLVKCNTEYGFVGTTEGIVKPNVYQKLSLWNQKQSWMKKKNMACIDNIKSQNKIIDCHMRDQLKSLLHFEFPFSLESLLSVTADENKTVVLAVAGYSYKDMLMNWACRLRHLLVTNFLICSLDHETYDFSVLQGLPVFHDPSAPRNISYNDCHFGTKCFQRVTKVKSRIVLKILKLGYHVLLSDVDVHWFGNPLPLLYSFGPAVLVAQSDEYNNTGPINLPRRLNSGFYFARSDGSTIAAMEKVVKHAATSSLSEQPSFYDTLCGEGGSNRISDDRCLEPETNLTVHFLDRNLFPNGAYLDLWQKKNVKATCMKKGCLILHNNWISGRMKKLERHILSGLWEYDSSKRMCLQSPNKDSHQESRRKNELGDSVALNLSVHSKDIYVRIVHAGGREELYQYAVPASQLMEKHPGMCVARPEVFKNPQESLVWPDENLLPGHKYLLIPTTTAKKLRRKHMQKGKVKGSTAGDELSDVNITWDDSEDISQDSFCSAKDFYASKDRSSSKVSVKRGVRAKKPFVPPLPRARTCQGFGWEPSLTSVQEVSP